MNAPNVIKIATRRVRSQGMIMEHRWIDHRRIKCHLIRAQRKSADLGVTRRSLDELD